MSGTLIQTLGQNTEGQILFEDFESPGFVFDQGWTIVHGVPVQSPNVAKRGQYSFPMDSSYPAIKKTLAAPIQSALVSVWFYDDASNTTSTFSPLIQFKDNSTSTFAIGVDNSTSTTKYVFNKGAGNYASTVTRTTGWHRFTFWCTYGEADMWIDNTDQQTVLATFAFLESVTVGASNYTSTAFGYFDWVQLSSNRYINVAPTASGDTVSFTSTAGTVYSPLGVSIGGGISGYDFALVDFPLEGDLTIKSQASGQIYYHGLDMSFWGGDIWTYQPFSFGRRPSLINTPPMATRDDRYANSGIRQSTFFNSIERAQLVFTDLTEQQKNQIQGVWSIMARGGAFGVALYEERVFLATLANGATYPATPGNTQVQLSTVAGLGVGDRLVLRSATGYSREILTVSFIGSAPNVVTFSTPLVDTYSDGDQARALYYWPQARATDKGLQQSLTNPRKQSRWNITLNFEETLGS